MHKEKHHRRFRNYVCQTGPSFIRKDTVAFDSCDVYPIRTASETNWTDVQTRKSWEEGMKSFDNSALFREDPFGVNDYAVNFSLNKKKRWEIVEEIKDRIEEIQDPHKKLRVSASIHTQDVSKSGYFFSGSPRDLDCTEYHSVTRDGEVAHRQSENGKTRLRTFSHPPRPARSPADRGTLRSRVRHYKHEDSDLPVEEGSQFQKAHVHYTTTHLTALPSLHNKVAHRSWNDYWVPYGKEFKYARPIDLQDESQGQCRCMIHVCWDYDDRVYDDMLEEEEDIEENEIEKEEVDEEDKEEYDVIDNAPSESSDAFVHVDRSSIPIVVEDLSAFVVNRKNRKTKK